MAKQIRLPTLLTVTDHPSVRLWIKKQLDGHFFIISAESEAEALNALHASLDFIIVDGALEESLEICKKLSAMTRHGLVPILLITGRLKKSFREKALNSGVTDFLSDQLDLEELQTRIAEGRKRAAAREKTEDLGLKIKGPRIVKAKIHLIELEKMPIFEQLQLEEALLRSDERSFCLINRGSPRAIVMGISGQPETLLHLDAVQQGQIPIIKRFSGGGTVIVDENTLFITFILAKEHLSIPAFPEPILRWSTNLYTDAWRIPHFHLKENDYCIGEQKCGGNAQYIKKDRWLHHTSFLWDYSEKNMDYLRLPPKRPQYRQDRPHKDFLTRLKSHSPDLNSLIANLKDTIVKQLYIEPFDLASWQPKPHRQATTFLHRAD